MAFSDFSTPLSTRTRTWLNDFFALIGRRYDAYVHFASRRDQIDAYNAKTDAELAEMGLTRADIARHVFRDKFHF
jgi:uncharacterized protein YjiS (DUF1127 family)